MLTALVYMLNRGTSNKYLLGHNLRVPTYVYIYMCIYIYICGAGWDSNLNQVIWKVGM